jgi:hypothetical protein
MANPTPFFCTLCSKGYARIHDFEAHENSYDHQHKKRFAEMKAMQRAAPSSASAAERSRRDDERAGLKPISLAAVGGKNKKKLGGFRSAFDVGDAAQSKPAGGFKRAFGGGEAKGVGEKEASGEDPMDAGAGKKELVWESDSDTEEVEGGWYDPAVPSGP